MTGARLAHWREKAPRQAMRLRQSPPPPVGGTGAGALAQGPEGSSTGANDWRRKWSPEPQFHNQRKDELMTERQWRFRSREEDTSG
jgi:hypothetical protein